MSECVQGLASIETGTLYVRNRVNKRNCTITRTRPPAPRAAGAAREPRGTRTRPRVRRARLPATRWRPIHIQHRTVARPLDPPAPAPAPHTNLDPAGARGCGDDCRLLAFFAFSFSQPGEGRTAWRTAGGRPGGVPCPVRAARCPAVAPAGPTRAARPRWPLAGARSSRVLTRVFNRNVRASEI